MEEEFSLEEKLTAIKYDLKYMDEEDIHSLFKMVVEQDEDVMIIDLERGLNDEGEG